MLRKLQILGAFLAIQAQQVFGQIDHGDHQIPRLENALHRRSDLVTILDFEKIVAEIAPETSIQLSEIDQLGERQRRRR